MLERMKNRFFLLYCVSSVVTAPTQCAIANQHRFERFRGYTYPKTPQIFHRLKMPGVPFVYFTCQRHLPAFTRTSIISANVARFTLKTKGLSRVYLRCICEFRDAFTFSDVFSSDKNESDEHEAGKRLRQRDHRGYRPSNRPRRSGPDWGRFGRPTPNFGVPGLDR